MDTIARSLQWRTGLRFEEVCFCTDFHYIGCTAAACVCEFDVGKFCSEPFVAGDFKDKCISFIGPQTIDNRRKETTVEDIVASQDTDIETATELAVVCDPANLRCPLEDEYDITDNKSLEDLPLDQCPLQSVVLSKNATKRNSVINYMFHVWETEKAKTTGIFETDLKDGDVLLSVMLYHPVKQSKEQGYLLLASQGLTELKDKIECIADHTLFDECSHNPEVGSTLNPYRNRSGFFFIEGVFYNDMRDQFNRDYSTTIMEWAKQSFKRSSKKLGSFKSKKMEETKFEDLQIRLGYPYYYCHQGNCEHLMIFDDMRLLHPDDPQSRSLYPYRIFKKIPKRIKCSICDVSSAKWITTNDVLAFEDPSYFCPTCFDLLHYDENKKKLHAFDAYRFDGNYAP